jgi:hypothetical protein
MTPHTRTVDDAAAIIQMPTMCAFGTHAQWANSVVEISLLTEQSDSDYGILRIHYHIQDTRLSFYLGR